jgi:hypothetical protein
MEEKACGTWERHVESKVEADEAKSVQNRLQGRQGRERVRS